MAGRLEPASGVFDGTCHRFALRVYYEDTDLSGVVYHANYLKFCERARSDFLRVLGLDQRAAHEAGVGTYAVTEAHLKFLAPARLDDSLEVQTRVADLRVASVRLVQRVTRGDDLLAELAIRVGFIGPDGRPRRQPEAWRKILCAMQMPESRKKDSA